ncbi:MAG: DUF4857 domain-containing protein [Prevotellaceae bacterium]|jgi:hypothetical protein|nr:DUF4857 domain-containing protein [Prevotellaceae bacterium]
MVRFSKIFLALTIALLLCWQLPWCYTFFFAKAVKMPFTLYSSVLGDFVSMGQYTRNQTDSLLPFFYVRQLTADERFPDSVAGVPVTPREVQQTNFTFRSTPSAINVNSVPLYPLLESRSGRVDLEMSDDVFRITSRGLTFITMHTNQVDTAKSRLFTEAMKVAGFAFPARTLNGNPTTRKEYDEGYLMLDRDGKLFHLKMVKGQPYIRAIALPGEVEPKHLFVTEYRSRKTLGFFTDNHNRLYVVDSGTYHIRRTGVTAYNPETDEITICGNLIDWTVRVRSDRTDAYYALRADNYTLIRSIENPSLTSPMSGLHFTSRKDNDVKARWF